MKHDDQHPFDAGSVSNGEPAPVAFWQRLQALRAWQQKHLPGTDSPQGMSLLIFLAKHDGTPRPIGTLYKESRSSEPSMRAVTRLFIEHGLATLTFDAGDDRRRMLCGTPKLRQVLEEYRQRLEGRR